MMPTTSTQTNPTSGSSGSGVANALAGSTDQLTNESTFLQLLVSQIQNQDPLNPTDSIQFVGQLVQFSQLEQLLGINQGVTSLVTDLSPSTGTTGTTGTTTNTSPTSGG
jgi:flagellar basal-body rod modification protein FlgD